MGLADFGGFGIGGYRSFGDTSTVARFGPIGKVHLVVGQNNVGKSNALHFMADVLSILRTSGPTRASNNLYSDNFDTPEDWSDGNARTISLCLRLTDSVRQSLSFGSPTVQQWLTTNAYSRGDQGVVWFDLLVSRDPQNASNFRLQLDPGQVNAALAENNGFSQASLANISSAIASTSGNTEHNLNSILQQWQLQQWIPDHVWVDAVRQITATGEEKLSSGQGIVARLAKLERPSMATYYEDRKRFVALESFVRDVLEDDAARLQIPDDKSTILIHGRFGIRELGHVGTGLNELILLATIASINTEAIICIEEPELSSAPNTSAQAR